VVAWLRPGRRRVLVLAAVVALVWGRAQVTRTGLEVVFFDVGHGDAVLLLGPEGRAVLVDTGPPGVEMSPAALRVLPYLRQQGVRRLDALVLTHAHADHYGGALDIAAAVACRQLVVATPGDDWPPAQLEAAVRARGGEVRVVAAGDAIRAGRLVLEVLYPPPGFRGDPNAGSLVLMVRYGQWSLLLTGDIPAEVELALVAQAAPHLAAQVLKVAHHGSSTSSHPAFLAATGAAHAVISAGGRFGHPAPAVEQRLREAGMTVWRTDQVGAVIVRVRGGQLEVRGYMCSVGDRAAPVESHVGGRAA
jgi:competence protein ComEC